MGIFLPGLLLEGLVTAATVHDTYCIARIGAAITGREKYVSMLRLGKRDKAVILDFPQYVGF